MSRKEYLNLLITDKNEPQIRAIGKALGLDPDGRGAYSMVINYTLSRVMFELTKPYVAKEIQRSTCPHCDGSIPLDAFEGHVERCRINAVEMWGLEGRP